MMVEEMTFFYFLIRRFYRGCFSAKGQVFQIRWNVRQVPQKHDRPQKDNHQKDVIGNVPPNVVLECTIGLTDARLLSCSNAPNWSGTNRACWLNDILLNGLVDSNLSIDC